MKSTIMLTDDYEILGIPQGSSKEEIKKAYRQIAQNFHPDKNKNIEASEVFNKATKAYDNLIIIKENLSKNPQTHQKGRKGQDIKVILTVTLDELFKNSKKHIATTRKGKCSKCSGTGSAHKKSKICSYCNGNGFQGMALVMGQKKACILCCGSGIIPEGDPCSTCSGTGLAIETIHKDITLSPLSDKILIHGYGNYCINGDPGNLIIDIYKEKHPFYTVHGLNITGALTISPSQAVIGDKVYIDVFGNKEEILIPPGLQNGHFIEKAGAGVKLNDHQGWLKIRVKIAIPSVITTEEKNHYEQILKIEKENRTCLKTWNL